MSEITLALEHPSLGCGEIIARYDLSEIQEKAYQQGRTDVIGELKTILEGNLEDVSTHHRMTDSMKIVFKLWISNVMEQLNEQNNSKTT